MRLTRPLFLLGGVMLYLLGTLAAVTAGAKFNITHFLLGQWLVTSIQLMTQYSNEYYDIESDRINSRRTWLSGGSGILANGAVSPRAGLFAALCFALLSLAALFFAAKQVPVVLLVGLFSLALAWSYSGPPLALARTGWGEASASILVALIVPVTGYIMQSGGQVSRVLIVACIPIVLIHLAMLIAFQIPDRYADEMSGKRTLLVRLGTQATLWLHNLSLFLAACVILALSLIHWPGAQYIWLALPFLIWQALRINRFISAPSPRWGWLTTSALALFVLIVGLWLGGFFVKLTGLG